MERSTWTDERLDDMVARNETRFELLHDEMREMRAETRAEMRDLRAEVREGFATINRNMMHLTIGMIGAFAALFAALVAQSF